MGKIFSTISMSLDGFIAGPDDNHEQPMGIEGERLHDWIFEPESAANDVNAQVRREMSEGIGAVVIGRRMFDLGEEPWGRTNPFNAPLIVTTHRAHEPIETEGKPPITFATGGLDAALDRARQSAEGRDILVAGGADIIRQTIAAGHLDELQISIVPLILNGGTRLFDGSFPNPVELRLIRTLESPTATHVRYRVVRRET
jgi:dihydrofolate reductase